MCRVEDTPTNRNAPLIPVAAAVRFQSFPINVYINFPANAPFSSYTYTPSSPATPVTDEIRRNAVDPTPGYGYKNFAGNSDRYSERPSRSIS